MSFAAQNTPEIGFVGIVLVNYNGGKFMPDCLESLTKNDYPHTRIVVVDNASTDGSADWTAKNHPEVALVRLETNTGITGGNNAGLEWCLDNRCDYILFLNNDTIVQPDFLSHLAAQAELNCLLVPKIYFYDNQSLINNHVGSFDYWRGVHRDWFYGKPDSSASGPVRFATMANTCALLMPRNIVEKVGFMDNAYFIYSDDIDYIARAVRIGAKIKFVPDAVLYHRESSSSGGANSPLSVYYTNRNRLYFMVKHQKNCLVLGFFLLYFGLTRCAAAAIYLARGQHSQIAAMTNGILDFCLGRMGYALPTRFNF